ncbi:hypothetical protein [Streptomyces sp. NPDC056682]|uniref:hypothetical protein n=1 Tax=Streptomyces sp. NPDC056682 TaxID=3345909 RepID=UPI0036C045C6
MTHPAPTKSPQTTPSAPHAALGTRDAAPAVRLKDDAEGVLSVLPFTVLTEPEASAPATAWAGEGLHVKMPFGRTPTARSTCACGRDRTARGTQQVRALIEDHTHHRTVCPLHHTPERRTTA